MQQPALSLDECLDRACAQLMVFLRKTSGHGAAVLSLQAQISAGNSQTVLDAVIKQCGSGSIKEQCDRALDYFMIDGSATFDPVSKRKARGEALRLISVFRRIHQEIATISPRHD